MTPEEHWDLWRRDPRASPFQSPAWLDAWWNHLGGGERADLTVRNEAGRLVAYLPAFIWVDGGVRKLVPVGAGHSDYCDALLDPGVPGAAERLLEAVRDSAAGWDQVLLPDMRPDSPLLTTLPGLIAEDTEGEICPVMALPDGKALLEIVSKSQRRKVKHDSYRAERLGGVTVALAAETQIDEAIDALIALHRARWEREDQPGVLADPKVQAFTSASAHALAQAGLLRLAIVRHGDRIVAVLKGFVDGRRGYSYINGVDMSVPGQSFGTMAFACLIEAAIDAGAREFHFLRGEEPYKYSWGAKPTRTVRRVLRRG